MHHRITTGAVGVLAAACLGLIAAPASAEVQVTRDAQGDGSHGAFGDMGSVRVKHDPRTVTIGVRPAEDGRLTDVYVVHVDTDASRRGPEFVVTTTQEVAPRATVRTTTGFDATGHQRCAPRTAVFDQEAGTYRVRVPRSCLTRGGVAPARVRVNASAFSDTVNRYVDWAPGQRRFGAWAAVG